MKKGEIVKLKGKSVYYRCIEGGRNGSFYNPVHPAASNQMFYLTDSEVIKKEIVKVQIHSSIMMNLINFYNAYPTVRTDRREIKILYNEQLNKKLQNVKNGQIVLLYNAVLSLRIYVIVDSIGKKVLVKKTQSAIYKNLSISIQTHGMFGAEGTFTYKNHNKAKEIYEHTLIKKSLCKVYDK